MPVTSTIKQTLQTSIDWLEFTIFQLSYEDVIERILQLKMEDFSDLSKGKFGYNAQTKWGNGNLFILFNQVDDEPCINHMGVHVILSGTGCRAYESQKSLYTLINVLVALEIELPVIKITGITSRDYITYTILIVHAPNLVIMTGNTTIILKIIFTNYRTCFDSLKVLRIISCY